MTISTQQSIITVAGNSSQTSFQFPFVADSASDISVSAIASNGSITLLPTTSYSLSINPPNSNQLWGIGGTVIYPLVGPPIATGTYLQIQRILPLTQNTSVQNQGNYYAQVTEQALDTLEMQIQQVSTRSSQWRGIWITGTAYNYGDIVQDGTHGNNTNNFYFCAIANTSGVWATDLGNGDWTLSAQATVPTGVLTLTGDVTATGTSPLATTLATVNSNIGTFSNATVTTNGKGLVTAISAGSASGGTVSSVTYTGDGVLQSSTPTSPVTTTGTLTATLIAQAKNTVLAGPTSGSNAAPTFRALVPADTPNSAKAWVVFDGTAGSPTAAAGFNIASITKNGTGDYTVNFTTAFATGNYAIVGTVSGTATNTRVLYVSETNIPTTGACRFFTGNTSSGAGVDCKFVSVAFFGT